MLQYINTTSDRFRRFIAHFIDSFIVTPPAVVLCFVLSLSGVSLNICAIISFCIYLLYFCICESSKHQATFGKRLCYIKVHTVSGKRLTVLQALVRAFLFMLPSTIVVFYTCYLSKKSASEIFAQDPLELLTFFISNWKFYTATFIVRMLWIIPFANRRTVYDFLSRSSVLNAQYLKAEEAVPASIVRRFLAFMLDFVVLYILLAVFAIFAASVSLFLVLLSFVLLPAIYFVFFERSKYQATPGKMFFKLYVCGRANGAKLTWARAFARHVSFYITTLITLSLAVLSVFFTKRRATLYDIVSGTVVYSRVK